MIGVFDSGLGGLTVLKEIKRQMPQYDYLYLGDSARAPYGNKSEAVIFEYVRQGVDFLFAAGCELIILACNTASAKALRKIQQEYLPERYPDKRVLGVLIPVVEQLEVEIKKNKKSKQVRTGIIGTKATISSMTYEQEIRKLDIPTEVYPIATPLLVPLVEEGWTDKKITELILRKYLRPLKDKNIDYLVLGCTHYPFLEKTIRKIISKKTKIISTPEAVAKRLKTYLDKHPEIEKMISRNARLRINTTDEKTGFETVANNLFDEELQIKKIELK